jgi:hypothetical protein
MSAALQAAMDDAHGGGGGLGDTARLIL